MKTICMFVVGVIVGIGLVHDPKIVTGIAVLVGMAWFYGHATVYCQQARESRPLAN